jgi:hypothetical protein
MRSRFGVRRGERQPERIGVRAQRAMSNSEAYARPPVAL